MISTILEGKHLLRDLFTLVSAVSTWSVLILREEFFEFCRVNIKIPFRCIFIHISIGKLFLTYSKYFLRFDVRPNILENREVEKR